MAAGGAVNLAGSTGAGSIRASFDSDGNPTKHEHQEEVLLSLNSEKAMPPPIRGVAQALNYVERSARGRWHVRERHASSNC
jgi:hypothetical protein